MSIYEAEIRRGIFHEDFLTSKVFGIFNIVNKKILLYNFLRFLGINVPQKDCDRLKITFWRLEGKRVPDVIISNDRILLYIEAKLHSISEQQLIEEYKDGVLKSHKFKLIVITPDIVLPEEIKKVFMNLKATRKIVNIQWLSWRKLNKFLKKEASRVDYNDTERKLLKETVRLLDGLGFGEFKGFNVKIDKLKFDDFLTLLSDFSHLCKDVAENLDIDILTQISKSRESKSINLPEEWLPHTFTVYLSKDKSNKNALFLELCLKTPICINYGVEIKEDEIEFECVRKFFDLKRFRASFLSQGIELDCNSEEEFRNALFSETKGVRFLRTFFVNDLNDKDYFNLMISDLSQLRDLLW